MQKTWRARAPMSTVALHMPRDHKPRGERIAELRRGKGLSRDEAAHAAGVTVRSWAEWEAGGGMKISSIHRVAEVLGVTYEVIDGAVVVPDPFSLADELHARVDEFRHFCLMMVSEFAKVRDEVSANGQVLEEIRLVLTASPAEAAEALLGAMQRMRDGVDRPSREERGASSAEVRAIRDRREG